MSNQWKRSLERYERAQESLIGGVSSPFRRNFPVPLYFHDGEGSRVQDIDGNWYIDYALAWGPLILGHKHPALTAAVRAAAEKPHNYGAQHETEFLVAELLCRLIPCAERVALTSSGSEAVQLCLRLARAFTRRTLIVKFEGHYHGWMDSALLSYRPKPEQMGSPARPNVVCGSAGQVANSADNVLVLPWNDAEALRTLFAERGDEIAAVITEPVLCNSGCVMPLPGFLAQVRDITRDHGALLIFDEIITGFRMAAGGAQSVFGVTPDLASFGKAIAGGLPLSAIAGREDVMELMISGGVSFGGTFNGNCLSMAAALATLTELAREDGRLLRDANRLGTELMSGLRYASERAGTAVQITGFGTAFAVHFTGQETFRTYRDILDDDATMLRRWLAGAVEEGIFLLPDGRMYTSAVHTSEDVERTVTAFERVLLQRGAKSAVTV